MLNIGNKKLKDANIGTTPLDSIYLQSTLIWKKNMYNGMIQNLKE